MSNAPKKQYRKRHLFARTVQDVVKSATQPLMNKQGKLYGALLRDWAQIVGPERAAVTRPERLQFPTHETSGATLHLAARPAAAPELMYVTEQMLEQCARYFGYRAITRMVIHASHEGFAEEAPPPTPIKAPTKPTPLPKNLPGDMRAIFERLAAHVASDKKS